MVKNLSANAGDMNSILGPGRSLGEKNGNPFQCSCLENSLDTRAWQARVHGVTKSQTLLSNWTTTEKCCIKAPLKKCFGFARVFTCIHVFDLLESFFFFFLNWTCLQWRRPGFDPWVRKIPWRRGWQPTPVLLPGEFHGQSMGLQSWAGLSD